MPYDEHNMGHDLKRIERAHVRPRICLLLNCGFCEHRALFRAYERSAHFTARQHGWAWSQSAQKFVCPNCIKAAKERLEKTGSHDTRATIRY